MRLGSLFDGSGGFPLAASMCGITPVFASEIEPYPIAVTKNRFPQMRHIGDVSKINGAEIEPVDIITFGSPCQDLSVAGKRAGLKHESNGDDETTRSGLFMEAVRIIKEMRRATNGEYPRFAVWENVPGAFSSNKGEDFRIVLEELIWICDPDAPDVPSPGKGGWPKSDTYVGDGWSLAYRTLDAQYWGVPQRRRRIYLVLDLGGECAPEILFKREGLRGYFEEGRTPWQGTSKGAQGSSVAYDCNGESGGVESYIDVEREVTVRKYEVDCKALCKCLREHKAASKLNNKDIAEILNLPITQVEHWFRMDKSFAIPDPEVWPSLKRLLGIDTDVFDLSIMEFEVQAGNYDMGNRIHIGEVSPTLTCECGADLHLVPDNPLCYTYDARGNGDGKIVSTLTGDHENRITDYTSVICCIDGDKIGKAERSGGSGLGIRPGDKMYTLTAKDVHGVCVPIKDSVAYGTDYGLFNSMEEGSPPILTNGNNVVTYPVVTIQYIVRRLTPTECARLQGFPDRWGDIPQKDNLTDDEYSFWLDVRNTYAAINGRSTKNYTKKQILTWYNKLYSEGSEYKMWGNGIALPNALYVLQGIAEVMVNERV